MQTILKQVLITPHNYPRICTRIVPQDQREAIRPGIIVSHYAFSNQQGHGGYIIINHTTRRAGICFAEGRTEWGKWDEWVNRQFLVWREERREELRDEAKEKWKEQAAEYERRWEAYVNNNEGALLQEFANAQGSESRRTRLGE